MDRRTKRSPVRARTRPGCRLLAKELYPRQAFLGHHCILDRRYFWGTNSAHNTIVTKLSPLEAVLLDTEICTNMAFLDDVVDSELFRYPRNPRGLPQDYARERIFHGDHDVHWPGSPAMERSPCRRGPRNPGLLDSRAGTQSASSRSMARRVYTGIILRRYGASYGTFSSGLDCLWIRSHSPSMALLSPSRLP